MNEKVLSIIIPCYNEQNSICNLVNKVLASPIKNKEIIIVEDNSTDNTREIIERDVKPLVSKIIYHDVNKGKGACLRTGFEHATGDAVIIQDADMEYDPNEYTKLVEPIFNDEADTVYGSRYLNQRRKGYLANRLANSFLTNLSNFFTGLHLSDMETCYKCFKREIIQSVILEEERFGFEPEVTSKLAKKGIRIVEVPISYNPRTKEEGKKIGFRDGIRAVFCILKYR